MDGTTNSETLTRPKADDLQADYETRRKNADRFSGSKHADECFLCGRGLTHAAFPNAWWIHLLNDGTLTTQDDWANPRSQGAFPVGSECARKIARPFKFKQASR